MPKHSFTWHTAVMRISDLMSKVKDSTYLGLIGDDRYAQPAICCVRKRENCHHDDERPVLRTNKILQSTHQALFNAC